jgi:hypothetical protein
VTVALVTLLLPGIGSTTADDTEIVPAKVWKDGSLQVTLKSTGSTKVSTETSRLWLITTGFGPATEQSPGTIKPTEMSVLTGPEGPLL